MGNNELNNIDSKHYIRISNNNEYVLRTNLEREKKSTNVPKEWNKFKDGKCKDVTNLKMENNNRYNNMKSNMKTKLQI